MVHMLISSFQIAHPAFMGTLSLPTPTAGPCASRTSVPPEYVAVATGPGREPPAPSSAWHKGRQCKSQANHEALLQSCFEDLKGAKGLMLAFQMWTNLTHCT